MIGFKAKLGAASATVVVALAAPAALATSAGAATPSCGSACTDIYTLKFGHHNLLDVFQGKASVGQEMILFQASNSDPAEDFVYHDLGKVGSFFSQERGLISPAFDQAYHSDEAYEIQYEPLGRNSNFCVGTWPGQTAAAGFKVRLETCGQTSTIWAADSNRNDGTPVSGYTALIAGETNTFSNPLVMNYPAGNPTDQPRPWLNVQPLSTYSDNTIFDSQQWTGRHGPA